ncbi:MAG TPA: hypothetical protein VGB20_01850 [bacterium]
MAIRVPFSLVAATVMALFVLGPGSARAQEAQPEAAATEKAMPEPAVPAALPAAPDAGQAEAVPEPTPEDLVREQLDGTAWAVEFSDPQRGGPDPKDVISFDGRQVSSEQFAARGFDVSNYSVSIDSNGTAVWETMQRSAEGDIAFWRGELHGGSMRGSLSLSNKKEKPASFSFSGSETSGRVIDVDSPG